MEQEFGRLVDKAAELILSSKRIVVFTGAGTSTESGVPDFRSPGGIWTKYDPDDFTYQKFLSSPEARKKHWQFLGADLWAGVRPNAAHYAVAEIESLGKLDCVITQNVDELHERAGNSPDKVIHLHGTLEHARCLKCGKHYPMNEVHKWLAEGIEVPECSECGGLLKPGVVFFGEPMPVKETAEARHRSQACDLCIVIGSSLVVYPAALIPRYAVSSGARLIIINRDPTELDGAADVCLHESAGKIMSWILQRIRERLEQAKDS